MSLPVIIQGGMGAGVSGWRLARSVALHGQLGVVSGTALDSILVRYLQMGDAGGHYRRAMEWFPFPHVASRVLEKYFVDGGKDPERPFARLPFHTLNPTREQSETLVLAAFLEVALAKDGHDGPVGINLLEKIQLPNLPTLYGAMLAGVDFVLMGAGIPREIPGALDHFVNHEAASMTISVEGALAGENHQLTFDPQAVFPGTHASLRRPAFLAIVSSATLASALIKRATGRIDGFVIEGPTAGGHNAPPRGQMILSEQGEPVYGPRDAVELEAFRKFGLPFWLAGSLGHPDKVQSAKAQGAQGVQVGTLFAFCEESGLAPALRARVLKACRHGRVEVFTDPVASPTGFPFKVVQLSGTLAEKQLYESRERVCDLGYLRHPYRREDGTIGYRCPSEPVEDYLSKGGWPTETTGRKCLCNLLVANIGYEQVRSDGYHELPLLTAGSDLEQLDPLLAKHAEGYSCVDVLEYLMGETG
ncbi:nitronate monooxygenase [Candidatus Poribacteria bacterium]|nr:nitronate monooxygenase [Candidatus Poribacteria bacterium]